MIHKLFYLFLVTLLACSGRMDSDLTKVRLKELEGQPINLSQFEGKTVFINFWATWCKPCIQEMPTIEILQDKLKNEKIVFLFASN